MSISYPLPLPADPKPDQFQFSMVDVVGMNSSPLTLSQEVFQWPGQGWSLQIGWSRVTTRDKAEALITFLATLKGVFGTFLCPVDPLGDTPRGSAAGTPLVHGAVSARSSTLATKGWTHSASGVLLAGDYLQLGSGNSQRIHKVLNDVNADSSGFATIDLWPNLRADGADGDSVVITACKGVFRLTGNPRVTEISSPFHYAAQISVVEAL